MSLLKHENESKSQNSVGQPDSDADPNMRLDVFQNHWKQAWTVMSCQDKRTTTVNGQATPDGVETVLHNLEQMVTLLVIEDENCGLPGPILEHVLKCELLEKICAWCTINISGHEKLRVQQLRLFELVISQAKQPLLMHRPVMKPLLRLLIDVADSHEISNGDLEFKFVLVLHQICICISQQPAIRESIFSTDADHGPGHFLVFSLLVPYVHQEGSVGQKARDALLLIMTLSATHPHVGQYIATTSDFCPVLATGLCGLYSSLPRRIVPPSEGWHAITHEDCVRIPDLQMFLNSLQFCNAVVEVAHPLVRNQLIEFIHSGFLVPVLAPALHQISREEVMAATAYLDLFIRHVTDPHFLKAVLRFVLTEKYDDVLILDSLLSRISSNSRLSAVTLSLFHTLVDLNCEDVMFQLVFRYLVPCTHVMVSQRRSVNDLDLYSKSAEKFLSLRPSCCTKALPKNIPSTLSPAAPSHLKGVKTTSHTPRFPSSSRSSTVSLVSDTVSASLEVSSRQFQGETNYFDYLCDARAKLKQTSRACHHWLFLYDGESPTPDSIIASDKISSSREGAGVTNSLNKSQDNSATVQHAELESSLKNSRMKDEDDRAAGGDNGDKETFDQKLTHIDRNSSVCSVDMCSKKAGTGLSQKVDPKLYASLHDLNSFMEYLNEQDLCTNDERGLIVQPFGEDLTDFSDFLKNLVEEGCQETMVNNVEGIVNGSLDLPEVSLPTNTAQSSSFHQSELPASVPSMAEFSRHSKANFEENAVTKMSKPSAAGSWNGQPGSRRSSSLDLSQGPSDGNCEKVHSDANKSKNTNSSIVTTDSYFSYANSVTISKEQIISKSIPAAVKLNQNSLHSLPGSVFSSVKSQGDLSPFRSLLSSSEELRLTAPQSPGSRKLRYLNDPPNIGPFLSTLFARLESMITNSLYFNLLLTDVLSRLAAYPQPLLRSFLFSHNLVFQPSVRSLIQVLSSLKQKLESISLTVKQFDSLVANAKQNLIKREEEHLRQGAVGSQEGRKQPHASVKTSADSTSAALNFRAKKVTLSNLIFRRSPDKRGKNRKPELTRSASVGSDSSYHYMHDRFNPDHLSSNSGSNQDSSNGMHSLSTWNAVYCALVFDEFLKELAALSQEHSVLQVDVQFVSR